MNGLYYLAHLVQVKNDLNRKRRRFYYITHPRYEQKDKPIHKAYTKEFAESGYRQAQQDMKAMTAHIRQVRTEIGATLIWGSGGQVNAIKHENNVYWAAAPKRFYHPELQCEILTLYANKEENQILALANQYRADQILLAD